MRTSLRTRIDVNTSAAHRSFIAHWSSIKSMEDIITRAIRDIIRQELEAAIAALPPAEPPAPLPVRVECTCPCRAFTMIDKSVEYWNTAQATAYLGLSRKTVLNMCSSGKIPFIKNGRINAYRPAELQLFRYKRCDRTEKITLTCFMKTSPYVTAHDEGIIVRLERSTAMETNKTFKELIEERRRAWSAPTYMFGQTQEQGGALASEALERPEDAFLEDTMPLPRYRPERLI